MNHLWDCQTSGKETVLISRRVLDYAGLCWTVDWAVDGQKGLGMSLGVMNEVESRGKYVKDIHIGR